MTESNGDTAAAVSPHSDKTSATAWPVYVLTAEARERYISEHEGAACGSPYAEPIGAVDEDAYDEGLFLEDLYVVCGCCGEEIGWGIEASELEQVWSGSNLP